MNRSIPLLAAIALGLILLFGPQVLFWPVADSEPVVSPQVVQCSRLMQSYADGRQIPEADNPNFHEYATCYRMLCGADVDFSYYQPTK